MLIQFQEYLTFENIYFWSNIGVIPFWLLILLLPNSKITHLFINSIILPLILSTAYIYVIYQSYILDESLLNIFNLFKGLDSAISVFSVESFLLIFWLHFLTMNLFLASWVMKDSAKYNVTRIILIISFVLIYFVGPVGLVFYWFFRSFYAKKINLHD